MRLFIDLSVRMIAGCVQHHRDGLGAKSLPLLGRPAAAHQVCATVCRHGPPRHHDRLHAPHHLPPVPWQSPHQGPEGRNRGVPDVALQVSADPGLAQSLLEKTNVLLNHILMHLAGTFDPRCCSICSDVWCSMCPFSTNMQRCLSRFGFSRFSCISP